MKTSLSPEDFLLQVARESWELFKEDALTFVFASLVVVLLSVLSFGLLTGPLCVGLILLIKRRRLGEPVQVGDVLHFEHFVSSLLALLLVLIAVSLGTLLLVVPGLLAALFSTFTLQAIAYEKLGALDAIRASTELVRDNFLHVLLLVIAITLLNSVASAVVLAVLLTLPLTTIALTISYEKLRPPRALTPDAGAGAGAGKP